MICKHCGQPIRWVEGHGWAKPNDAYAQMGICAKREQGHQLRDEKDYELAVARIWKALRTLDSERSERAELAEAGVAGHTVEALLGDGFENIATALIQVLTPGSLNHFAKHKRFTDTSAFPTALSQKQLRQYRIDWEKWGGCEKQWDLVKHIETILPLGLKQSVPRQCATYLWEACWWMAHTEQLSSFPKRDEWIVNFIERLLPDLFKRVNAYHRAARTEVLVGA